MSEQHGLCIVERFDLALPTHTDVCLCSIGYQTFTMSDSFFVQNGEAYGGLGTCRSRKMATFIVQSLGWYFLSLGE